MAYFSREQWGARPAKLVHGVNKPDYIFAHHSTGAALGADFSDDWCRNIDHQHHNQGWEGGIGYSFLYDRYGNIFEGRGWGVIGGHTFGYNSRAHAFCFLGNGDEPMTKEAQEALRWLIAEHDRRYGVKPIKAHGDVNSTHCPGNSIRSTIRNIREDGVVVNVPMIVIADRGPIARPVWGLLTIDGVFGAQTIHALQASLNETGANPQLSVDGAFGTQTKRALQGRLNHTNGPVGVDGVIGAQTVRALQAHVSVPVDGNWGPQTTRGIQSLLNRKGF